MLLILFYFIFIDCIMSCIYSYYQWDISLRHTVFEVKNNTMEYPLTSFNMVHVSAYVGVHDHLHGADLRLLLHAAAETENPSQADIFACCFGGFGSWQYYSCMF